MSRGPVFHEKEIVTQMKPNTRKLLAKLAMAFCAFCWGVSFVVVKDTTSQIQTNMILVFRYMISAVAIGLFCTGKFRSTKYQEVLFGGVVGAISYFAMYLQTGGLVHTTPGKSAFLTAAYCVFVPFITWIWDRKRPQLKHFAAAVLCLIGIGFIALQESFTMNIGDVMTIGCAIIFALTFVMIDKWYAKIDLARVTFFQMLVTGIVALAFVFFTKESWPALNGRAVFSVLYLSLIATALCMFLQNLAQRFIDPSSTALICSLESVFAALASVILIHERPTPKQLTGFVIVFSAVVLSQLEMKKKEPADGKGEENGPDEASDHGV